MRLNHVVRGSKVGKNLELSSYIYRRLPAPSDYDWESSKSGWELEEILYPFWFHRDFYVTEDSTVQGVVAPVRYWDIGNYGRKFGHSVDIASENTGKEMVVVGAPQGKFIEEFMKLVLNH